MFDKHGGKNTRDGFMRKAASVIAQRELSGSKEVDYDCHPRGGQRKEEPSKPVAPYSCHPERPPKRIYGGGHC